MFLPQHRSLWLVVRLNVSSDNHTFYVSGHIPQAIRALYQNDSDCLPLAIEVTQSESLHLGFWKLFMHRCKLYSRHQVRLTWITKYGEKWLAFFVHFQH